MPRTPFATTGAANPRRLHVGNRVRFIDPPILAKFVPAGVTGKITAKVGYRAFEVECDGLPLAIVDLPENLQKCRTVESVTPYAPIAKFISRKKSV